MARFLLDHIEDIDLDKMKRLVVENYREFVKDKAFCVRVKRAGGKDYLRQRRERIGFLSGSFARKVDLKNPESKIEVELTPYGSYFFASL